MGEDETRAWLLRGHFTGKRSLGPEDLAAMRPAAPPRPRKPRTRRDVAPPAVAPASAAVFGGIVRAAIRELLGDDPDLNSYKIGKALKSATKGTIGDRRSARLLAEVQAEARVVTPIGSRRIAGD